MRSRMLTALALLATLPMLASATITDAAKFNQLKPGTTTAPQTVELLGKPDQENRSPDGRFAYMYEFDLPNTANPKQPSMAGVAALLYTEKGVLQDVQLMKKADPGSKAKPASGD